MSELGNPMEQQNDRVGLMSVLGTTSYWLGWAHAIMAMLVPVLLLVRFTWHASKRAATTAVRAPGSTGFAAQLLDCEAVLVCGAELEALRSKVAAAQRAVAAAAREGAGGVTTAEDTTLAALRGKQRTLINLLQPRMLALDGALAPVAELLVAVEAEVALLDVVAQKDSARDGDVGGSEGAAEKGKDKDA